MNFEAFWAFELFAFYIFYKSFSEEYLFITCLHFYLYYSIFPCHVVQLRYFPIRHYIYYFTYGFSCTDLSTGVFMLINILMGI